MNSLRWVVLNGTIGVAYSLWWVFELIPARDLFSLWIAGATMSFVYEQFIARSRNCR
jgi:hypothetical protein